MKVIEFQEKKLIYLGSWETVGVSYKGGLSNPFNLRSVTSMAPLTGRQKDIHTHRHTVSRSVRHIHTDRHTDRRTVRRIDRQTNSGTDAVAETWRRVWGTEEFFADQNF